jgi:hypothetical protein
LDRSLVPVNDAPETFHAAASSMAEAKKHSKVKAPSSVDGAAQSQSQRERVFGADRRFNARGVPKVDDGAHLRCRTAPILGVRERCNWRLAPIFGVGGRCNWRLAPIFGVGGRCNWRLAPIFGASE